MSAPAALLGLFDELVWVLRREGFPVSIAQAIDVARAVDAVGLERMAEVREAVAAVVLQRSLDRPRFDAAFDAFFAVDDLLNRRQTLSVRLSTAGFSEAEIEAGWALVDARLAVDDDSESLSSLRTLLERGAALDRLLALAGTARSIDAHSGSQLGFRTHRLLALLGVGPARHALADLRTLLGQALGGRGLALADALAQELGRSEEEVRAHVRASYEARVRDRERAQKERRLNTTPFGELTGAGIEEVRRGVRRLAERLRGAARVRSKRAARTRIDPHRTLRSALRSGGVPFRLMRKPRRTRGPKVVILCDVSDSVREAAAFFLEFTYAAQELFARARSFVFVSKLGEVTELLAHASVEDAITRACQGILVRCGESSNYGRVFGELEARYFRDTDRRTTVIILGDGRTNYHPPHADVLERLRLRSRTVLWLCPEPPGKWGQGDSAMGLYAPACTAVYEVSCAEDLERVARLLVGRV